MTPFDTHVSIARCPGYEFERVEAALHSALDSIGGMKEFIKKGHTVLLKVNMLAAKAPEKGITTHPAVLEAVAREVIAAGGKVIVADSPAGVLNDIDRFWDKTGIGVAVEAFGGELLKLEGAGTTARSVNGNVYHLASLIDQVDVIINLPKLKTHGLTLFTGAIKNCFGLIPGFKKAEYHKSAPKVEPFSRILVDIYSLVKPRLHIMDAILGLEGNGPSTSGTPRDIGLIAVSPDAVALDSVSARIIGLQKGTPATARIAAERGLGVADLDRIRIEGPSLEDIAIKDFVLPSNYYLNFVPTWLVKLLGRFVWVRPKANEQNCIGCGVCIENCPVDAMSPNHRGIPDIDYSVCINCLSCDESCSEEAIEQKVSWLAKRLS